MMDTRCAIQLAGPLAFIEEWLSRAVTIFTSRTQIISMGRWMRYHFKEWTNIRATLVEFKGWTHIRDVGGDPNEGHRCVSCLPSFAGMTEQWPPRQKAGRHGWPAPGRGDPAQKCKHLNIEQKIHLFTQAQTPYYAANQALKSSTDIFLFLEGNEDCWVEKLKPTMMNWCVLCLQIIFPTTHSFWPGRGHPKPK